MYLEILRETLDNQHKIVDSYESITKKLEAQINECQDALEDSTKREMEQLQLIMELKDQYDNLGDDDDSDGECKVCSSYEEENELMREQTEQQSQVIEKLSKAQEMLMMQYKVLEIGLNQELASIQKTQLEIDAMKSDVQAQSCPPPQDQDDVKPNEDD